MTSSLEWQRIDQCKRSGCCHLHQAQLGIETLFANELCVVRHHRMGTNVSDQYRQRLGRGNHLGHRFGDQGVIKRLTR